MKHLASLVVFSDLDGTLLDHDTYCWEAARPALECLARLKAAVVLASSKTAAEIIVLRKEMGLQDHPVIVENGAGLIGPHLTETLAVDAYHRLRGVLDDLPGTLRRSFCGFGDMRLEELMACTGLGRAAALRARDRAFSEPGLWSGDAAMKSAFLEALGKHGVTAKQGGRFLTLSFGGTKADHMATVTARIRPRWTIALGDAPNDIEMLERADFGVIIANPYHDPLPRLKGEAQGAILRTHAAGPEGWNGAVLDLVEKLSRVDGETEHG